MTPQQTLLIIGFVWPEPQSSAAGKRMIQLIELFPLTQWKIVFASPALPSPYMADLTEMGIQTIDIVLNSETFDTFITELSPQIVLFDRFMIEEQFGWRVAQNCPNALRILDTEDLHCLRHARHKAFKSGANFVFEDLLNEPVAQREIASILRCDVSLIISEVEIEVLTHIFRIDKALLYYLPIFSDITSVTLPDFESRFNFIFIGNFHHAPNLDAVLYLKDVIWPLIVGHVDADLLIYGAYTPAKIKSLHNTKQRFLIMDRADAAAAVIRQARVLLAPLRFGAGLKGKLIEAMQLGTPSVTSTVGAEGIAGDLPWNGQIEDTPQEFADAAIEIYHNKLLWDNLQQHGFKIVETRFSRDIFAAPFLNHIQIIRDNIVSHRHVNFIGRMLMHHTMRSTEYMSRWIEAKNKS